MLLYGARNTPGSPGWVLDTKALEVPFYFDRLGSTLKPSWSESHQTHNPKVPKPIEIPTEPVKSGLEGRKFRVWLGKRDWNLIRLRESLGWV